MYTKVILTPPVSLSLNTITRIVETQDTPVSSSDRVLTKVMK